MQGQVTFGGRNLHALDDPKWPNPYYQVDVIPVWFHFPTNGVKYDVSSCGVHKI